MNKVPLTVSGEQRLREELLDLKQVQRPKVIQAIADAREHGDLKENAEYHAAREQQSFIEGRIKEIEGKLGNAQVIDVTKMQATGKVIFGSTVRLLDLETEKEITYQIVGDDEADIKENRISFSSPVAKALIGKFEEDEVSVQTPSGIRDYEILKVEYI
ncbi:MAG: transcription elongation factor GreA [Gammaproteobacteria bacterium]|nr:transcription elongation factor GreA [Gammaproteobacteria bacterium]